MLVADEQLKDAEETCVLIDGTVRRVPVAELEVEKPYYTGKVKAVCMRNPLYDLIIGNATGVDDEVKALKMQAVVTRSQTQQQDKPSKPLKTAEAIDMNVD